MIAPTPDDLADVNCAVVIVAAGSGSRFGSDKTQAILGGKPLWQWSVDRYRAHPAIRELVVVGGEPIRGDFVRVEGGAERQESSRRGLDAVSASAEVILVHDAARPFVSASVIDAVIRGCLETGAAAPVVPVTDTLRYRNGGGAIDRSQLIAMQTPQGARAELLRAAHAAAKPGSTDEIALIEALGAPWQAVPGSPSNFKITVPEDLERARACLRHQIRTGFGYDIHAFSKDPARRLWLGGVSFPEGPGLEGHSDADVLLHALTDALLGAAAMGDIGQHFPPSDSRWKDEPSLNFLRRANSLISEAGWHIVNLDVAAIAERPKIMPRALEARTAISHALGLELDQVSIKATTNEGLGALGRAEGIAAYATATIERWIQGEPANASSAT